MAEPQHATAPMVADLAVQVKRAAHVAIMTGSGISAESGIPTFRDAQTGLWARYRPEDLATPEAFEADPATVWEWYAWRRKQISEASPNAGHRAIVALAERVSNLSLITQNVDGLHQLAGSADVIELHGSIIKTICHRTRRPIDTAWLETHPGTPPPSPHAADGLARPGVVWFGEALPSAAIEAAARAAACCDVFMSIGTSALVEPAASLGRAAAVRGAYVAEINPAPTPLSDLAAWRLRAPAGEILPALVRAMDALD